MNGKISLDCRLKMDQYLENIYPDSKAAGEGLAAAGFDKTQIRGLESIIVSATRLSEILNFIKNQIGKENDQKWAGIGPTLIEQLVSIEGKSAELGAGDPELILAIKMKLARAWGRQVVTHCLFRKKIAGGGAAP